MHVAFACLSLVFKMFERLRISQFGGNLFLVSVAGFRVFGKAYKTCAISTIPAFSEGPQGHVWHPGWDSVGKSEHRDFGLSARLRRAHLGCELCHWSLLILMVLKTWLYSVRRVAKVGAPLSRVTICVTGPC